MPQTLGRREKSFMVGFPAELSWLKGNEEVGRRDTESRGIFGGLGWGGVTGAMKWGASFLLIFFRAAKTKCSLPELANTFSL